MRASPEVYNAPARAFHWLLFLLIAAEFGVALTMPDIHRDTPNAGLVAVHLALGSSILVLMVARLAWRLIGGPAPAAASSGWQDRAARAVHALLYLGFIALPLLGWINASARGYTVELAGLLPLPALAAPHAAWTRGSGDLHQLVAWGLAALIGLHVAAAFYHQLVLRDNLLRRMWPARRLPQGADNR